MAFQASRSLLCLTLRLDLDDTQPSALYPFCSTWSGFAGTTNLVFASNDHCTHSSSQPVDVHASLFASEPLVETHYSMQRNQEQGTETLAIANSGVLASCRPSRPRPLHIDDVPIKCIDPRLLSITHQTNDTPLETRDTSTIGTQLDPGLFSPPTTTPAAHLNSKYAFTIPTGHHTLPLPTEAPAHIATHASRPAPSQGIKRVRHQDSSPYQKKRRAKAFEVFTQQLFYHSLPPADREYFDQVVTNLRGATYLISPQVLEPTVGSPAGLALVGPRRSTGPGTAAGRESVYAILVDRPVEGPYVCWLCGEKRADRRLPRALDHVRGHFKHRPYHCLETHFGLRTGSGPSLPLASVW